ncbi:MAG: alpha/beta hydrolase fold domain-containing protein [Meiothermus silvanus]|nr:alpha/beta hydrolase fold domain-containing protein [Allomeiothermus silvanus]
MSEALPKRSELPREQQWSIETVFANEAEWEKAFQEVSASLDELKPFAGRLGESAQTLLQALQKRDRLNLAAQKVGLYASLNLSTDGANPTYAAMNAQASSLIAQVNAAAAFIVPEILRIEPAKLEQFMAQEPELAVYRHYLERPQLPRAHIRSAEEAEAYARKLRAAGVSVTAIRFQGMIHDFVMLHALAHTNAARAALTQATATLREAFGTAERR